MKTDEIYVALLDEGVNVWRPVPACHLSDDTYVILRPDDYDPDDERWAFEPGSVVTCEQRKLRDGDILAAAKRVELDVRKTA